MSGLCRGGPTPAKSRRIDMALLMRVPVIIRHERIAMAHPQVPQRMNAVTGFLHHLAVQRGNRLLSGINATAGQLKLRVRGLLETRQKAITRVDDRISAGAGGIIAAGIGGFAKTSVHDACSAMPQAYRKPIPLANTRPFG